MYDGHSSRLHRHDGELWPQNHNPKTMIRDSSEDSRSTAARLPQPPHTRGPRKFEKKRCRGTSMSPLLLYAPSTLCPMTP